MHKILFIFFVFMAVNTNDWEIEAKKLFFNITENCEISYADKTVCGSDGNDYHFGDIKCVRRFTEYGKRVNLQTMHDGACYIWEDRLGMGFRTITLCIAVSKLQIDAISTSTE